MSPRPRGRTQRCDATEARSRLARALAFLEVADILGSPDEEDDPDIFNVAAALAVLAGIAAADAACCKALGQRSHGADHHDAEALLSKLDGANASVAALRRLINMKDEAHYGFHGVNRQQMRTSITQARRVVAFAQTVLAR